MIALGAGRRPSDLAAVSLSLDEMQVLMQLVGMDRLPTVLMAIGRHADADERDQAYAKAREDLAERGLLTGDQVHVDLEDRIGALSRPHWVVAMRLYIGDSISRLCLAKGDDLHVLVLRGPESYLVSEVEHGALAAALVSALPVARGLEFNEFRLPTDRLSAIANGMTDPNATAAELADAARVGPEQTREVANALTTVVSKAEIVGVVYGEGSQDVAPGNIAVFDTPDGRILIGSNPVDGGAKWSSVSTGSAPRLRKAIQDLINALPTRQAFPTR
ncbi:MAG: ESX secretion-associated protein EspG [Mycobacteriaceae bacterium]|nr:ESX secretion-associated protein EspG [Mycobacteriaceae bacterium]